MTSFDDLDGAFRSLADTLQHRYSPLLSEAVGPRWLGCLGVAGAIARDIGAWNRLADPPPGGEPLVAALDGATRALAVGSTGTDEAILAALTRVDAALHALRACLDGGGAA